MRGVPEVIAKQIKAKQAEIQVHERQIVTLQYDLDALKRTAAIISGAPVTIHKSVARMKRSAGDKRVVRRGALGDGIEKVLRDAKKPVHKKDIAAALDRMHVPYTKYSLDSALRKDHRGRFHGTGKGFFELRKVKEEG